MLLIKNAVPDRNGYSGYGIEFDACLTLLLPNGECGKDVDIFYQCKEKEKKRC